MGNFPLTGMLHNQVLFKCMQRRKTKAAESLGLLKINQ